MIDLLIRPCQREKNGGKREIRRQNACMQLLKQADIR